MDVIDLLKSQIAKNESERIANDANETTRPKILHTQYLGDRTVQQLGQEPIENAVVLNNAANAIGDALMPLAKGSPLQRFDSVNQDDGVGTKRRSLLDDEANRNRRSTITIRTGEQKPANDPLIGTPRGDDPLPPIYPPPFGCVPVGGGGVNCIWTTNATPPTEYQSHGSAVINENGLELFLHCKIGVVPPTDLGCTFLDKWKCSGGVCSPDANGPYNSQAECEAARIVGRVLTTQSFSQNFNGAVATTYPFTVTAPAIVSTYTNIKCYLVSGVADDCLVFGSFTSPCAYGRVWIGSPNVLVSSGSTSVSGSVINLIAGGCSVSLSLRWEGDVFICP